MIYYLFNIFRNTLQVLLSRIILRWLIFFKTVKTFVTLFFIIFYLHIIIVVVFKKTVYLFLVNFCWLVFSYFSKYIHSL